MEKMAWKVVKVMMRTSSHGNKKSEGYSILESALSILISSLLITVVLGLLLTFVKLSDKTIKKVDSFINEQNSQVEEVLSKK